MRTWCTMHAWRIQTLCTGAVANRTGWNVALNSEHPFIRRTRKKCARCGLLITLAIVGAAYCYPLQGLWGFLRLPVVGAAVIAGMFVAYFWAERFRKRVAAGIACPNCGYNTTGLMGPNPRCPECGWALTARPPKGTTDHRPGVGN